MKIVLINPNYRIKVKSNLPKGFEKERGLYPPLGLGYLAAILEAEEYRVKIIDSNAYDLSEKELLNILLKLSPDLIGLTTTSFTLLEAKRTAKAIKNLLPEIPIVIGGPHVSIYPKETISNKEFDIGVMDEGEFTFLDLVKAIENGKTLENIKGLVFKKKDLVKVNERRTLIKEIDSLPFPSRHLMPNERYYCPIAKRHPFTIMITSRGCPYNCTFCLRSTGIHFGRKFRARSAKNVVDEIEECMNKFNIKEILFYDDTFTVNRRRVVEICREIKSRKLDIYWDCRTRVDLVDQELLRIMRNAGCLRIHYGVESGTQEILNFLNKGYTLAQVKRAFKWSKEAAIRILSFFMIGTPNETLQMIQKTINFAKQLNTEHIHLGITTAFPGTELYNYGLNHGYFDRDVWREFALGKLEEQPNTIFETEEYSSNTLNEIINKTYKEFYLKPTIMLRRVLNIGSLRSLLYHLRGLLAVLRLD